MPRHRRDRRCSHRGPSRRPHLGVERLEGRIVYAASIGFDPASRVLSINGSEGNDTVEVRQQGRNLVASLNSASGRLSRTMSSATVSQIVFTGNAGNDTFTNLTAIASRANGGSGNDVLRGGSAGDELIGGPGNDRLSGDGGNDTINAGAGNDTVDSGTGNDTVDAGAGDDSLRGGLGDDRLEGGDGTDSIWGGNGNDMLNGNAGSDMLVGGRGRDREVDGEDWFADGDNDRDGYDNDWSPLDRKYDWSDVFNDYPGNESAWMPDRSVAPTIATVSAEVRKLLGISADDAGLRVRVSAFPMPGVTVNGMWRYRTADNVQVNAVWSFSQSDPSRLQVVHRDPWEQFGAVTAYGVGTGPVVYTLPPESVNVLPILLADLRSDGKSGPLRNLSDIAVRQAQP